MISDMKTLLGTVSEFFPRPVRRHEYLNMSLFFPMITVVVYVIDEVGGLHGRYGIGIRNLMQHRKLQNMGRRLKVTDCSRTFV